MDNKFKTGQNYSLSKWKKYQWYDKLKYKKW